MHLFCHLGGVTLTAIGSLAGSLTLNPIVFGSILGFGLLVLGEIIVDLSPS